MPVVHNMTAKAKVVINEYERGWGQRELSVTYYDNWEEAQRVAREHNEKEWAANAKAYGKDVVPDTYFRAEAYRVG